MAGSSDAQEKTLAPSPHRLQQAREQGERWSSVDLPTVMGLVAAIVGIPAYLRGIWPTIRADLQAMWMLIATPEHWERAVLLAGMALWWSVGPIALGMMVFGLLVQFSMQGFQLSFHWKFHNPLANIPQWLSVMMLWNLLKGLGKVIGMVAAAVLVLWIEHMAFIHLAFGTVTSLLGSLWHLIVPMTWAALVVFAVWGVADAIFQRRQFQQKLKMSRHDQQEEMKQQEGDPHVRQHRRGLHRQLLRNALASVDDAAVVITNPTHAAVALAWAPTDTEAPRVVAKGWDETAAAIRERAYAARVPMVQNPPLARSLMTSPLDQPIAEPYWRDVSVVLIFILRRRQAAAMASSTSSTAP